MKRLTTTGILLALIFLMLGAGESLQLAMAQAQPAGKPFYHLFYTGKRRSRLAPCGCHSKQQGGLQFEPGLYAQYADAPIVKVDAGEWTYPNLDQHPENVLQTSFLLRGLKLLDYDAVNVGLNDTYYAKAFFENLKSKHAAEFPNLVSANVFWKDQPGQLAFAPSRIVTRKMQDGSELKLGLTGVTILPAQAAGQPFETRTFVLKSPKDCLGTVVNELRPQVDQLMVLVAGDYATCIELAKAYPQIDTIIVTGAVQSAGGRTIEPTVQRYRQGNTDILNVQGFEARVVGLANFERQGPKQWRPSQPSQMLPVAKDVTPDERLLALHEEFKMATRELNQVKPPEGVKQIYAGVKTCMQCHQAEYEDWKQTGHAHALQTLIDKNQHFNPACVKCHTTGFRQANGFYSYNDSLFSRDMFNVQCEVCHGPALEHVEKQQMLLGGSKNWMSPDDYNKLVSRAKEIVPNKRVPEAICLQCHTPENDNHFVYGEKLLKVSHKHKSKPAAQAASAPTTATTPAAPATPAK